MAAPYVYPSMQKKHNHHPTTHTPAVAVTATAVGASLDRATRMARRGMIAGNTTNTHANTTMVTTTSVSRSGASGGGGVGQQQQHLQAHLQERALKHVNVNQKNTQYHPQQQQQQHHQHHQQQQRYSTGTSKNLPERQSDALKRFRMMKSRVVASGSAPCGNRSDAVVFGPAPPMTASEHSFSDASTDLTEVCSELASQDDQLLQVRRVRSNLTSKSTGRNRNNDRQQHPQHRHSLNINNNNNNHSTHSNHNNTYNKMPSSGSSLGSSSTPSPEKFPVPRHFKPTLVNVAAPRPPPPNPPQHVLAVSVSSLDGRLREQVMLAPRRTRSNHILPLQTQAQTQQTQTQTVQRRPLAPAHSFREDQATRSLRTEVPKQKLKSPPASKIFKKRQEGSQTFFPSSCCGDVQSVASSTSHSIQSRPIDVDTLEEYPVTTYNPNDYSDYYTDDNTILTSSLMQYEENGSFWFPAPNPQNTAALIKREVIPQHLAAAPPMYFTNANTKNPGHGNIKHGAIYFPPAHLTPNTSQDYGLRIEFDRNDLNNHLSNHSSCSWNRKDTMKINKSNNSTSGKNSNSNNSKHHRRHSSSTYISAASSSAHDDSVTVSTNRSKPVCMDDCGPVDVDTCEMLEVNGDDFYDDLDSVGENLEQQVLHVQFYEQSSNEDEELLYFQNKVFPILDESDVDRGLCGYMEGFEVPEAAPEDDDDDDDDDEEKHRVFPAVGAEWQPPLTKQQLSGASIHPTVTTVDERKVSFACPICQERKGVCAHGLFVI